LTTPTPGSYSLTWLPSIKAVHLVGDVTCTQQLIFTPLWIPTENNPTPHSKSKVIDYVTIYFLDVAITENIYMTMV